MEEMSIPRINSAENIFPSQHDLGTKWMNH
jgi:hypothetical protein